MKDYYDILGISRNASEDDIKRAYRILAHQYHPDTNNGNEKRFKEVNEAYRILSGSLSRAQYDQNFNDSRNNAHFQNEQQIKPSTKPGLSRKRHWQIVIGTVVFLALIGIFSSNNNQFTTTDNSNSVPYSTVSSITSPDIKSGDSLQGGNQQSNSQSPDSEKCATESGVKICDLSYSVAKNYGDGTREVHFQANAIDCLTVDTGNQTQNQGNSAVVSKDNTYCVSDLGAIYIDPTIKVKKYFNQILRQDSNSNYHVPDLYHTCIWTYADGNGAIPYILVSDNVGPSSGFNVEAFCRNGTNQVDIYSYVSS